MRGTDLKQEALFSYISPEARVPADHPLRALRGMVDGILKEMSPRFARLYAKTGRPSIPPAERDAALLMASRIPGVKSATLGADKNYDTRDLVRDLRQMAVTPHVAQNDTCRARAIDGRTTRHDGYVISPKEADRRELRVDESDRAVAEGQTPRIGESELVVTYVAAAYNLWRLRGLQTRAEA